MNNNTFANETLNGLFSGVNNIENADAVATILDRFGLNWKVALLPLMINGTTPTPFFGVTREDNGTVFSAVRGSYEPFQNSELAEMLIRLSEKTGYNIHKGGMFNGGGKVYIQLESPNKLTGIGKNRDTVNGFLTGITSHDQSTSLGWGETNITISCLNTFMAALRSLRNKVRHTSSLKNRVEAAIAEVNGIVEAEKALFDTFIKLSEVPVTRENITTLVKSVTGVDTTITRTELEKNYSTYAVNRAGELLAAIAKEMGQKGETMWGLFSGVTQYTSHVMPAPKRENGRIESLYIGSGFNTNNEAFELVSKMAKV